MGDKREEEKLYTFKIEDEWSIHFYDFNFVRRDINNKLTMGFQKIIKTTNYLH